LDSVDDAAAKAVRGVVAVVRDGSFLGVVAEREEQAIKARAELAKSAKWTLGPQLPDAAKIYDHLPALPAGTTGISEKQGPALAAANAKTLEATYHRPYTTHGSIGPSCALAELKDGKMTVWTHAQGVFPLLAHLAPSLGMKPADIHCIHVEGSGCYG